MALDHALQSRFDALKAKAEAAGFTFPTACLIGLVPQLGTAVADVASLIIDIRAGGNIIADLEKLVSKDWPTVKAVLGCFGTSVP